MGLLFVWVVIILASIGGLVAIINNAVASRTVGAKRTHRQVAIAERALRSIANGTTANSVLEAQIALDEITNLYETKELN